MEKGAGIKNSVIYFVVICAGLLVAKAAQLQVLDTKYKEQAKRATLDKNILYPSRGLVWDRNNKLLVTNTPLYDIDVIYRNVKHIDTSEFCKLLQIDESTFVSALNKDWSKPQYHKSVPFTFLQKIKPEQFTVFQEHLYKFPGFYPKLRNIRSYPHTYAANVLGYLGEVNQSQIDRENSLYKAGDYIGVNGIERKYEEYLKGRKGITYVLKDNLGREVGTYENGRLDSLATPGDDLYTSLDLDLQGYAEELLKNKRGSVVAIEPSTGEILAMVSAPSYDPNLIALDKNRGVAFDSLLRDTINRPFLDRSTMALYPPGSIFKPIMSLIALQKGILYANKTIYCDGEYELDSRGLSVQKCHAHPTPYNLGIALEHSCNSYFYQTMRDFVNQYGYQSPGKGLDTLVNYLFDFGLGKSLGADVISENDGYLPDSKFYDKVYRREVNGWRATYILSVGIGQGELQVTTLQMANLASIIANRGYFYTPHIVKAFSTKREIDPKYETKHTVRINKEHFDPVILGMYKAVTTGTAYAGYVPGLDICGKTGTSENPFGKDHSVFFGFAPMNNPKIAIAVYVENAGWGGAIATPIGSLVIEKYLNGEISERRKYLENRMKEFDLLTLAMNL